MKWWLLGSLAIASVVVAAALRVGGKELTFVARPVAVAALPTLVRADVEAHRGGRCIEQHPSVYLCILAQSKQAHEGASGHAWCYDSDGARTFGSYPANHKTARWECAPG